MRRIPPRLIHLLLDVDNRGARFVLMIASLCWSVLLLMPGDGFSRAVYAPLKSLGPDWAWGLLFGTHFLSTLLSTFLSLRCRPFLYLEGLLGLALYAGSTLSAMVALDSVAPLFSPGIACVVAALWVLVRYPEDSSCR